MPLDTVLCLDTSGSMAGRGMRELKRAAEQFLEGIQETAKQSDLKENVAIVEFGGNTRIVKNLSTDYVGLRRSINSLSANGRTPMKEGLTLAMKEILEHGGVVNVNGLKLSPRIVLMTDGKPTGETETQAITEVLTVAALFGQHWRQVGLPHPIPIACVGCGDADKKLLEGIAKITKGMFTMVDSMEELSTFFRRQVILSRFVAQFSHDMSQLRSLLALQQFMRACGEAVEEAEARSLRGLLGAMLIGAALEDSDDEDGDSSSYPTPPPLGTRIRRGPQWKWGDQDGNGVGTIVKHSDTKGWVDVRWDNGRKNSYRFGKDNAMDVKVVNEPRKVTFHEGIKVGVRVVRGKDWKWSNQDGGTGSKGYVYDVSEMTGVCKVRWEDGSTNTYRNGAEGAFDLRVLPEDVSGMGTKPTPGANRDPEDCTVM
ncbi:uncharacterized protein LOC114515772 [Dendronephthya gigantea]|uniref:uncharacterized protein LOC114515772 n=1 Tax=Dendronephthya gigantea TaxID=151771 RepID=UPI00106C5380|nr:uncharacterized protein LOC114515772 [Dendronephthya gigantea]